MAVSVSCKALERRVLDVRGAKSNAAGRRNSPVLTVYTLVNLGYLYAGKVAASMYKMYEFKKEQGGC